MHSMPPRPKVLFPDWSYISPIGRYGGIREARDANGSAHHDEDPQELAHVPMPPRIQREHILLIDESETSSTYSWRTKALEATWKVTKPSSTMMLPPGRYFLGPSLWSHPSFSRDLRAILAETSYADGLYEKTRNRGACLIVSCDDASVSSFDTSFSVSGHLCIFDTRLFDEDGISESTILCDTFEGLRVDFWNRNGPAGGMTVRDSSEGPVATIY